MYLMANYGIKDDMSNEHTIFYSDKDRYMNNGIEKKGGQERQLTIYE